MNIVNNIHIYIYTERERGGGERGAEVGLSNGLAGLFKPTKYTG